MSQFNIIMSVVGIILMFLIIIWTLLDKKKVFKVVKDFDQKKSELIDIINDAEQMIEELNKFSDYIVTQMDLKDEELRSNLKKADEQIRNIGLRAQQIDIHEKVPANEKIVFDLNNDMAINDIDYNSFPAITFEESKQNDRRNEKVVPINNKYSEVLKLSRDGYNESEIAKKLKIGKGEIQLILGINKN